MLAPIQEGIQHLSQRLGLSDNLVVLERAWESELGGLAAWARLVALERSYLVVEVASSVAMQELSLRRRELVRRINRHFPDDFIKDLTFRMAPHG